MKKLLGILVLTACASFANADYSDADYGSSYSGNYGRCQGGCNVRSGRYEQGPQGRYDVQRAPYGYQYIDRRSQYGQEGQQAPRGQFFQQDRRESGYSYDQAPRGQFFQQDRRESDYSYDQAPQGLFFQDQRRDSQFMNQERSYAYQDDRQQPGQRMNPQQADQEATKKIQDSLRGVFTNKYNNVNVTFNNGTVTLQGTVATPEDRKDLEEKVRNMDGVRGVNNQVTVANPQQGQNPNAPQQQYGPNAPEQQYGPSARGKKLN